MRILFDQGTPAPLRDHLPGHSAETAYEKGVTSWPRLQRITREIAAAVDSPKPGQYLEVPYR